ncbi:transposase [Nostoc commune]|uniref:transposase n=1 Tax=Nostoc commune TaxID=1178 RepID=UPI001FD15B0A|nr:transposase [Nostoc commune]
MAFPSLLTLSKASLSDDCGFIEMFEQNIDYFISKPVDLPKITILVDHGYHPEKLTIALEQIYPQIMTKIQFELSAKPSKAEKEATGKSGFVPVAARWVIERSNAWVERCKSLVKNFDRTLARANAKLKLCFIRLMLKRLAAS